MACNCPEGYELIDGECVQNETVLANGLFGTVEYKTQNNISFPCFNARLFEDITALPKPIKLFQDPSLPIFHVTDNNNTDLILQTPLITNLLWGGFNTNSVATCFGNPGDFISGRGDYCNIQIEQIPTNASTVFKTKFNINIPSTKQYCLMLILPAYNPTDGFLKIYFNDVLTINAIDSFNQHLIFPITLNAGIMSITFEVSADTGSVPILLHPFGFEIYDITDDDFITYLASGASNTSPYTCGSLPNSVDPYILFTTIDYRNKTVANLNSAWTCTNQTEPILLPDPVTGIFSYVCNVNNVEDPTCFCYKITPCDNSSVLYSSSPIFEHYIGQYKNVNSLGYTGCALIEKLTTDCPGQTTEISVSSTTCSCNCYIVIPINGDPSFVSNDPLLETYVNSFVDVTVIDGYTGCAYVKQSPVSCFTTTTLTIGAVCSPTLNCYYIAGGGNFDYVDNDNVYQTYTVAEGTDYTRICSKIKPIPTNITADIQNTGACVNNLCEECFTVQNCTCPEGFAYIDGVCIKEIETEAIITNPITILPGDTSAAYGSLGGKLYNDITNAAFPITGNRTAVGPDDYYVKDANNVNIVVDTIAENALWGSSVPGCLTSTSNGRLNITGVKANIDPETELSFEFCITIYEAKQYIIGIAGDNAVKCYIDGDLKIQLLGKHIPNLNPINASTVPFRFWHLFPITLLPGPHIIKLSGINYGSNFAFGAEIYDQNVNDFKALTMTPATGVGNCGSSDGPAFNQTILFSTAHKKNTQIPDPSSENPYTCPSGGTPVVTCDGAYCVTSQTAPPSCNIYKLTPCTGEPAFYTTNGVLQFYLNQNVFIDSEVYGGCVFVEAHQGEEETDTICLVETTCECPTLCYKLQNCQNQEDFHYTCDDLSNYVGKIIKFENCGDVCWEVSSTYYPVDPQPLQETITNSYLTCEACYPVTPVPETIITARPVDPGYFYKNPCVPIDYIEKVNDNFSNNVYDQMISVRYGIQSCCEIDVNKWDIKKNMLDFELNTLPEEDLLPVRPCYCYTITVTEGTGCFKYISCLGDWEEITVSETGNVCSKNTPQLICPTETVVYTITSSTTICTSNTNCI